jgi:hypothetical protein
LLHQSRAVFRIFGSTMMPPSRQARRPSAAYWEFELSPFGGPGRRRGTGIFGSDFVWPAPWPILGFSFSGVDPPPPDVATSSPFPPAPPVATGSLNFSSSVGAP